MWKPTSCIAIEPLGVTLPLRYGAGRVGLALWQGIPKALVVLAAGYLRGRAPGLRRRLERREAAFGPGLHLSPLGPHEAPPAPAWPAAAAAPADPYRLRALWPELFADQVVPRAVLSLVLAALRALQRGEPLPAGAKAAPALADVAFGALDCDRVLVPINVHRGVVAVASEPPWEPLAEVVGHGLAVLGDELERRVEAGQPLGLRELSCAPARPGDDHARSAAQWRALTGTAADPGGFVLSASWLQPELLVPRALLLRVIRTVAALNRDPAARERFLAEGLQLRPDLPDPDEETGAPELETGASSEEPEPPEAPLWRELEAQARALDAAEAGDDAARVAVRRRSLLFALEEAGLFEEARAEERRLLLEDLGCDTLRAYLDAARQVAYYLRSEERRSVLPNAAPGPGPGLVLGGPVALDWFRRPQPSPAGYTPLRWLAACELGLRAFPVEGGVGSFLARAGAGFCRVYWRKEDGVHEALVRSEPLR